ncbi:RdgB/HAM1 family non-canonical purine NTP pyrophosphatase [Alteromonas flava]|uniref:RdgB/HAM1 family non-canonical purine NTP pyrophosphatase n=1 Tax=Alteromonas flava TaxID=2048003 RepID=UPI000C292810|nr:RdgB/HAM1 family non-canonical purine NTP pyrophosphatase [Alteromonas flava]
MQNKHFVLASGNAGKVAEFNHLFSAQQVRVTAQTELKVSSVPETGTTFIENAIIKARHASAQTGLPAIADDSGLVVDALQGAPGIYSSRYAGAEASDSDNIDKLLAALREQTNRRAHFYCCLVFMRHADDPVPLISEGLWHGEIAQQRAGQSGFGYDPVFFFPALGCTAAELSKDQKSAISHRAKALEILLPQVNDYFA